MEEMQGHKEMDDKIDDLFDDPRCSAAFFNRHGGGAGLSSPLKMSESELETSPLWSGRTGSW